MPTELTPEQLERLTEDGSPFFLRMRGGEQPHERCLWESRLHPGCFMVTSELTTFDTTIDQVKLYRDRPEQWTLEIHYDREHARVSRTVDSSIHNLCDYLVTQAEVSTIHAWFVYVDGDSNVHTWHAQCLRDARMPSVQVSTESTDDILAEMFDELSPQPFMSFVCEMQHYAREAAEDQDRRRQGLDNDENNDPF